MECIRFLSFNIHGGRSRDGRRDLSRVRALMDRLNVDVGIFQEMETRPSRGGTEANLDQLAGPDRIHRFTGPTLKEPQGWFGNLIVSRYPMLHRFVHDLQTGKRHEPRGALDVLLDTPLGKIRVVGTHLSLSLFQRHGEAQRLLQLMAKVEQEERHPLLLMGDINEWQIPSKLLRFLNGIMSPVPCGATFPSWLPVFKLDRVWHDAAGFIVSAHRLYDRRSRVLSDHLPVIVEVISHKAFTTS